MKGLRKAAYNVLLKITFLMVHPILRAIFDLRVNVTAGLHSEISRPVLLIANHRTVCDPWIVLCALPYSLFVKIVPVRIPGTIFPRTPLARFLANIGLTKAVYWLYRVIPISPECTFERKIQPLISAIKKGDSLILFPEGKINYDSEIGEFKRGAAYLQTRTKISILPVSLDMAPGSSWRKKCTITYGDLLTFEAIRHDVHDPDDPRLLRHRTYLRQRIINLHRGLTVLERELSL